MNTFELTIAAYDSILYRGNATMLIVSTPEGEIGIEAHHEPFLAILKEDSELRFSTADGSTQTARIRRGLLSFRENRCILTVEAADSAYVPGGRRNN